MSVINLLSPHVADMIAAGEVVERPASVIKELVENAFDAGAHNITVEIRGGGATYIRVTDDGCGMSPEDAGIAFLRHATSKLHDEKGLECIGTMGFRGEALAAISAVSKIELTTRRRSDGDGTRVLLTAGDIQDMLPTGCPAGTTMIVRDLFYNTPARLKFLKSDRAEASACELAALRCALGHPETSVRFIKDGAEMFFSPGDGRENSCVYSLLGRDLAASLLECAGADGSMKLHGFVSSPSAGRGNRGQQYFFVNGRFIRSQLLQSALEGAYKNTLLTGRYPACVLYLDIGFGSVDVNVHPAKTEVKFSEEKRIFDLVHYAVLATLGSENRTAEVQPSPSTLRASEPRADFYRSMSAEEFRAGLKPQKSQKTDGSRLTAPAAGESYVMPAVNIAAINEERQRERSEALSKLEKVNFVIQSCEPLSNRAVRSDPAPKKTETGGKKTVPDDRPVEKPVQNVENRSIPDHKIVGEAMKTYIIVELDGELLLIDKHAAHERIIFDRLKAQKREITAQTLLVPAVVRLSGEQGELLEANGELFGELGFEIEPIGEREYAVHAVPADMYAEDAAAAVEEICEKLREGRRIDPSAARDELLHTVACKAAIKAGWDSDIKELERLVEAVLSGRVKYCPHGRPVSVTVTRKELDKKFKRIV